MKRTITAVLFALSMSNIGAAGTKSRCQESLEEGGWTVHLSDKFNEIDTIALAACIYFTGGAGTLQCLGDVVQEVAQEIGWDLLQKTIENRGRIVSGPGELKTQVGVCSKTYPIALGARGTDHYVFLRYKRGSVESSVATNSMQWYHDDCNAVHRSQTAACTASAHRYCVDQQHSLGGLSQEVGPTGFAIACINKEKGRVYEVPLSQFQSIHGDCNSVHNSWDQFKRE